MRAALGGFDAFTAQSLDIDGGRFVVRRAESRDLPTLVGLLRNDSLGSQREHLDDGDLTAYEQAFDLIAADPNQLLVAVDALPDADVAGPSTVDVSGSARDSAIVGTLQLSLIPGLARTGALRLQIEAVRIAPAFQGRGLGRAVFEWAHSCGRTAGATLVQLTTDKSRTDAHRFYDRLGYVASHEGLKRQL
ncbi:MULTISPECIES: GNAT family N-acetyltransferase [unclassified Brevibacterium]|uniref:GNAT family N-acetyltransferase n=1 Tax=unclassified Brevibacterium TaxID=2614124 RepID=UPI003631BEF0